LAAAACQDQPIGEIVDRVRKAQAASPLALAIADIVQTARVDRKAAVLGAIIGAHGSLAPFGSSRDPIEAAIAGAAAASAIALIENPTFGIGLQDFLLRNN
jgi:hypothetical protein